MRRRSIRQALPALKRRGKAPDAAQEEADHLALRGAIAELDAHPSRLNPFSMLPLLRWVPPPPWQAIRSAQFVHATEEVASHLRSHLKALPGEDRKSLLILQQMLNDEERHGAEAPEQAARSSATCQGRDDAGEPADDPHHLLI